jgi:hypothetical protein
MLVKTPAKSFPSSPDKLAPSRPLRTETTGAKQRRLRHELEALSTYLKIPLRPVRKPKTPKTDGQ